MLEKMISHGKDMKVFSGNANMNLAKDICRLIGIQLGNAEIGHFSDGEVFASIELDTSPSVVPTYSWFNPPAAR